MSTLMVIHEKQLVEMPERGSIEFPRRVLERYSLLEWLEFEKAFTERAFALGLEINIEEVPFTGRVVFRWRKPQ